MDSSSSLSSGLGLKLAVSFPRTGGVELGSLLSFAEDEESWKSSSMITYDLLRRFSLVFGCSQLGLLVISAALVVDVVVVFSWEEEEEEEGSEEEEDGEMSTSIWMLLRLMGGVVVVVVVVVEVVVVVVGGGVTVTAGVVVVGGGVMGGGVVGVVFEFEREGAGLSSAVLPLNWTLNWISPRCSCLCLIGNHSSIISCS
jgi:hypothetical protein